MGFSHKPDLVFLRDCDLAFSKASKAGNFITPSHPYLLLSSHRRLLGFGKPRSRSYIYIGTTNPRSAPPPHNSTYHANQHLEESRSSPGGGTANPGNNRSPRHIPPSPWSILDPPKHRCTDLNYPMFLLVGYLTNPLVDNPNVIHLVVLCYMPCHV
ncbi:hypothetical protein BGX38DRAFT_567787 [Terfezia claveryi]|nr:hypothetical protein BGX38DRAFT_567787 [Terfezia claveryi]